MYIYKYNYINAIQFCSMRAPMFDTLMHSPRVKILACAPAGCEFTRLSNRIDWI